MRVGRSPSSCCCCSAWVALYQFEQFAQHPFDPSGMLAFGFVVLASYTIGGLVGQIRLPHITGYLIAGLVFGPSLARVLSGFGLPPPFDKGILNDEVIEQLSLFDTLAVALIAPHRRRRAQARRPQEGAPRDQLDPRFADRVDRRLGDRVLLADLGRRPLHRLSWGRRPTHGGGARRRRHGGLGILGDLSGRYDRRHHGGRGPWAR